MPDNLIYAGSRHRIRRWRNYGITSSPPVAPVEFLFRDDFITAEVAPLTSPRTAEPGPGVWNITDITNAAFSISGGELVVVAGNATDVLTATVAIPFSIGLVIMSRIIIDAAGLFVSHRPNFGGGWLNRSNLTNMAPANVLNVGPGGVAYSVNAVIRGATTNFYVVDNVLYWVDAVANVTSYTPVAGGKLAAGYAGRIDYVRVSQLPSPWDTDYGIATDRLAGARGFGDQFVHEADFIGEFIQTTVPTAGFTSFQFRRQGVNNYWSVVVEPSQDLSLSEVVAGVPTQRGISVGVVNNGDRIVVIADGATIRVYEQNTLRITYALAANFQTETDGSLLALGVGGAVSDIVAWPRIISGAALRALDRVANA